MTESISNRAIINALQSIDKDIKSNEASLAQGDMDEEEYADTGEVILEMQRAMGEFLAIYKLRCAQDDALPSVEQLLGKEWG